MRCGNNDRPEPFIIHPDDPDQIPEKSSKNIFKKNKKKIWWNKILVIDLYSKQFHNKPGDRDY
jgi:hypothetical protein